MSSTNKYSIAAIDRVLLGRLIFEHFPLSIVIGLLAWILGGGSLSIPFALAMGWCIDIDHLVDFFFYRLRYKGKTNWGLITNGGYFLINGHCIVLLHSWELTLLLIMTIGLFSQNWILAFGTGIAHAAHLFQDMRTNHVRLIGYSLIMRAVRRFPNA